MERTQVYLPKNQIKKLKQLAQKKKTTFSNLVRDAVEMQYGVEKPAPWMEKEETLFDVLEDIKKMGAAGPKDLAKNMDEYLYHGKK